MTALLVIAWILSVLLALCAGCVIGGCLPYVSTAIRCGSGFFDAILHALRENGRDIKVVGDFIEARDHEKEKQ